MEKLSKRKLESYKRAEIVCRELRAQLSDRRNEDTSRLTGAILSWMDVTGKIKFERTNIKPRR